MTENKDNYNIFDTNISQIVQRAKNALTEEQKEEYKKIGEYMFTKTNYQTLEMGSTLSDPTEQDILFYATEALKSGGEPKDLSVKELQILSNVYGEKWYEKFGFTENELLLNCGVLNRKQRRQLEKNIRKNKK